VVEFINPFCEHGFRTTESFTCLKDENNKEYAVLTHETSQTNRQGCLQSIVAAFDKRVYATDDSQCQLQ